MKAVMLLPPHEHFKHFSMHVAMKTATQPRGRAPEQALPRAVTRGEAGGPNGLPGRQRSASGRLEGFISDARNHIGWPDKR